MKILLLEDNKTLNETIKLKFELNNYQVETFTDGQEAYNNITNGYSCFILDINVPNVDGIKILKKIREYYENIPVLIISASVELELIKESYAFGCNDYLKKPFFIDELEIKVDRLCKVSNKIITFDTNCHFNFKECLIIIEDNKISLTQKENLLINLFLMNKNELISYDTIQNYVWEGEYTSLDAIRTLVRRLRKKLTKSYIKSSSKRGYFFILNK
ncbi:MAG: response regulator transcription factor [Campylobacteraceae bacterium]|nr:response regulator transcription factor [Campylobacteraceae bacterium]